MSDIPRWALMLPEGIFDLEAKSLTDGRVLSDADSYQWVKWADVSLALQQLEDENKELRYYNKAYIETMGMSQDQRNAELSAQLQQLEQEKERLEEENVRLCRALQEREISPPHPAAAPDAGAPQEGDK